MERLTSLYNIQDFKVQAIFSALQTSQIDIADMKSLPWQDILFVLNIILNADI